MNRKKVEEQSNVVTTPDAKFRRLRSKKMEVKEDEDHKSCGNTNGRQSGDHDDDDVPSWQESVWRRVRDSNPGHRSTRQPCTIYKVPADARRQNSRVYLPTVVSIGPYHCSYGRRESQFGEMQSYKWRCLGYLLRRRHRCDLDRTDPKDLLDRCLDEMKSIELKVQSCYSRVVEMEKDEFAEMLLLDGCFVLHLLLSEQQEQEEQEQEELEESEEVPKLCNSWIWSRVVYDLLLLENQIPFFVVDRLFRLLKTATETSVSLPDLALKLFDNIHPSKNPQFSLTPDLVVHHLLHLFYLSILPSPSSPSSSPKMISTSTTDEWILTSKHLKEAGIKVEKKDDDYDKQKGSLLDISFVNGVIKLPPFHIYDYSSSLFSNLIAFEQYYPQTQGHVTTYSTFMEWIVNNSSKIGHFHMDNVIVNMSRTDKKGGSFFDGLCSSFFPASSPVSSNYLGDLFVEVNNYHGSKWRRWSSKFLITEESDKWMVMVVMIGVVLLVLTSIQTIVSILSYFHPPCSN